MPPTVPPPGQPEYLSLKELALRHRCSIDAARSFLRRHRVRLLKPSARRLLIPLADLLEAERALTQPDSVRLPLAVRPARVEPDPLRSPLEVSTRRASRTRRHAGG